VHSPDVQKTELGRKISEEKLKQTISKYLPRLNASADFRNNFQRGTIILPISIDPTKPGQPTALKQGTRWNATLALDATQNIYDPSASADKKINQASLAYSKAQIDEARINKKVLVSKAYYAALLSGQKVNQLVADTARKSTTYRDLVSKFSQGKVLKTEVDKALIQRNNSVIILTKAVQQSKTDLVYLAYQMGMGDMSNLKLTDRLDLPKEISSMPSNAEARADYKTEKQNREMSILNEGKVKKQYLPTVQLYGYLGTQAFRDNPTFLNTSQDWYNIGYAGIKVSVPVFDGFEKKHQMQQQSLSILQSNETMKSIENQAAYETQESLARMDDARRTLTLQSENVKVAEGLVQVAKAKVDEGRALEQEFVEADYTLSETRQLYLQSVYEYLVALVDYEKASGITLP
jgi:outer membrane protein TolC